RSGRNRESYRACARGITVGLHWPLSGVTATEKVTAAWAEPVEMPPPSLPDIDALVRRPVTADGRMTRATPLPLDTFIVVFRRVWVVPPPSCPPTSVQAVSS